MRFEDVLEIKNGRNQKAVENPGGQYPIYGSGGIMGYANDYICDAQTVIIGRKGNINSPIFVEEAFWNVDTAFGLSANRDVLLPRYLYYFCKKFDFKRLNKTVTIPSLTKSDLLKIEIDLPDLEKQHDVVDQLVKIERIITLRKQELEFLDELIKARFVEMFGNPRINPNKYPTKLIKDTCIVITGNTPSRKVHEYYGDAIEWIKTDNIVSSLLYPTVASESLSDSGKAVGRAVDAGAILMACIAGSVASIGRVCITDREVAFNQQINAIVPKEYDVRFLHALLQISKDYLVEDINMSLKGIISKSKLEEKEFIVPSMEEQVGFADFVKQIDKSKFQKYNAIILSYNINVFETRRRFICKPTLII